MQYLVAHICGMILSWIKLLLSSWSQHIIIKYYVNNKIIRKKSFVAKCHKEKER
jgi:hypothetical protein